MVISKEEKQMIDALDALYPGIEIISATITYKTEEGKFRFSYNQVPKGGKHD